MSRLEESLKDDDVDVLLLNIHTPVGSVFAARYGFRVTPTYILIDASGEEVWRGYVVPTESDLLARLD